MVALTTGYDESIHPRLIVVIQWNEWTLRHLDRKDLKSLVFQKGEICSLKQRRDLVAQRKKS